MADSCQCMTKPTAMLWSKYPPTNKNKWKGKKKELTTTKKVNLAKDFSILLIFSKYQLFVSLFFFYFCVVSLIYVCCLFFLIFIYFWLHWVLVAAHRIFTAVWGLFVAVCRLLSSCCVQAAVHRLSSCGVQAPECVGSVVVAHGLNCPAACGILVPWLGIESKSPALEGGFLTTGPWGKSLYSNLYIF